MRSPLPSRGGFKCNILNFQALALCSNFDLWNNKRVFKESFPTSEQHLFLKKSSKSLKKILSLEPHGKLTSIIKGSRFVL
eukprot:c2190_g1_i2 orf=126-365(+)